MLRTRCQSLAGSNLPRFTFAGFQFPRYIATLRAGSLAQRAAERRPGQAMCGDYYHSPQPGSADGWGFYLDCDGGFRLRVEETGPAFYADEFGDSTMQGIVLRLPRGRGFLAGWTMGRGMASSCGAEVFESFDEAARAAESEAESAAERERDYQAAEAARLEAEEREAAAFTDD